MAEITTGLCECGCGLPTKPAPQTSRKNGWVRGEPLRFVKGHQARKPMVRSYRAAAVRGKTERVHRIKAEAALGKPLPAGSEVHHADGTKSEHSPLVICQDHAYHMLLHARTRILRLGGDPNTQRTCADCKRMLSRGEFFGVGNQCRDCQRQRRLAYRAAHHAEVLAYESARRAMRRKPQKTRAEKRLGKVSEAQAREALRSHESSRVLAGRLGVSVSTVRAIRNGQNWRHLHEPTALTFQRVESVHLPIAGEVW